MIVSNPSLSCSSNLEIIGLSMSSTPITLLSILIGITISEFEALSQAMCPGN